jgi:hypothetical protein
VRNRGSRRFLELTVQLAAACLLASAAGGVDELAAGVTNDEEAVLARAAVPDEARKIGEVQLIRRGTVTAVRTVLSTRVLARAVAEIRAKEDANWPEGSPHRPSMLAYVAALERAEATLRASLAVADPRTIGAPDRRLRLLIEFFANDVTAGVALAEYDAADSAPFVPIGRRGIATPTVSRGYVLGNMRLIVADAFGVEDSAVDTIGPLGPAATTSSP